MLIVVNIDVILLNSTSDDEKSELRFVGVVTIEFVMFHFGLIAFEFTYFFIFHFSLVT